MPTIAQKYNLKFLKKENIAKNTYSIYFERPENFEFLPGQFMRLILDIPQTAERSNGRFFSIASSPTDKNYLMITIRIRDSDFKKTLLSMAAGTKVQIAAPYGVFVLKPEEAFPRVLIAGGIGITPFHSMIRYACDMKLSIPITLFNSFSTTEDLVFQSELKEIEAKYKWFKLIQTITKPEVSQKPWSGNTGRIDADMIKKNVPDLNNSVFYIAGPPPMVDAVDEILKSLRIDIAKIKKEKFTGY